MSFWVPRWALILMAALFIADCPCGDLDWNLAASGSAFMLNKSLSAEKTLVHIEKGGCWSARVPPNSISFVSSYSFRRWLGETRPVWFKLGRDVASLCVFIMFASFLKLTKDILEFWELRLAIPRLIIDAESFLSFWESNVVKGLTFVRKTSSPWICTLFFYF